MVGLSGIKFNATAVVITVIVLLLLVFFGWYFYKQGKKKVTLQSLPDDLPGSTAPSGDGGSSNNEIKIIANGIYDDIDGLNVLGHNNEPYNQAILLSDRDVVKLYDAFNSMYQTELGETLTKALIDEKFWENKAPDTLIARLKKLNCL